MLSLKLMMSLYVCVHVHVCVCVFECECACIGVCLLHSVLTLPLPLPSVGFATSNPVMVSESDRQVNVTVQFSGTLCGEIEIRFSTNGSTAMGKCVLIHKWSVLLIIMFNTPVEDDYNLGNDLEDQILTLSSDDLNDTITINIVDDDIIESDETISITLAFLKEEIPRVELRPSYIDIVIMDDNASKSY